MNERMFEGPSRHPAFPFIPVAQYHVNIGSILYLREDVSYRADPIDQILELLWHPHKAEVVGVKVNISFDTLIHLQEIDRTIPLANILNFTLNASKQHRRSCDHPWLDRFYRIAREVVGDARLIIKQEADATTSDTPT